MTARAYFVDGVQLVNVGGELCESCEQRPGVGHSLGGSVICARCAGWAAREASEYAAEVEASKARRAAKHDETKAIIARVNEAFINSLPSREVQRRVRVAEAAKASNHKRAGTSPGHYACGHQRTRANTYKNSAGRPFCRQCRAEDRRNSRQRLKERRAS